MWLKTDDLALFFCFCYAKETLVNEGLTPATQNNFEDG